MHISPIHILIRFLFYCVVISSPLCLFSQNEVTPIGYWREHLPYQNAQQVVKGDKVYCATIYNIFSKKHLTEKLFLSFHTVHTHRKNVMQKLGVNNTAGVVMFAVKNNLLVDEEVHTN